MKRVTGILVAVFIWAGLIPARGADLVGTASVNVTSDTSANAKTMALNEARRQILRDTLRQYAIADQLLPVLAKASSAELTNLIASSGIDGERTSDTTYSANITMTVDRVAAKEWMNNHNIQNWLTDGTGRGDTFIAVVTLTDPMADWARLNAIARAEKIDLGTKFIGGKQVTLELPVSVRGAFTIAIREAGWNYSANEGILQIWR